jgi:hypothetical protein
MKSNNSVFSFSHWGSTQSTNKRVERIAWFYFTNAQTYILYKLFGSFFTIKYTLPSPIHINKVLFSISEDQWAAWLISKSETPWGIRGMLSKTRHLRRAYCIPIYLVLSGPPSPPHRQFCCLHIPIPFVLFQSCIPFCFHGQIADPTLLFDATARCLISPCTVCYLLSLDLASDCGPLAIIASHVNPYSSVC